MNPVSRRLIVFSMILFLCGGLFPSDKMGDMNRDSLERMTGLCKLWGAVKFFHPYIVSKEIDWDGALVETVPRVLEASSSAEYRAAIEHLLSFLQDDKSRVIADSAGPAVRGEGEKNPSIPEKTQPYVEWLEEDVALVKATDYLQFIDLSKISAFMKVVQELKKARSVIFDLRRLDSPVSAEDGAGFYLQYILNRVFPYLLTKDVRLPTSRYRMYSGFPTASGSSSGGYFSSFVYLDSDVMTAQSGSSGRKPMVVIINEGAAAVSSLLIGLQQQGVARIIQVGDFAPDDPAAFHVMTLADDVSVRFRLTEPVNPDGTTGFRPDVVLKAESSSSAEEALYSRCLELLKGEWKAGAEKGPALNPVVSPKPDKSYTSMLFPDVGYRYLSLFRFWNVINYFYPYKHLLDDPWDKVLETFIPEMAQAENAQQYALTVARLVTHICDTHGFVSSPVLSQYFGTYFPPIQVKKIEGETVITHLFEEEAAAASGLKRGDVIVRVDGVDIREKRENLGQFFAASTPQALSWRVDQRLLSGPKGSNINLSVKSADGKVRNVTLKRERTSAFALRETPVFSVLDQGYGYMDLQRLTVAQVDEAFELIKNTPALILDMRGYPKQTAWAIAPRLIDKKTAMAHFQRPEIHATSIDQPSIKSFYQYSQPSPKWKYRGKIVMLINEEAISQAEHTCLFMEAAADATFIGSPTNGANGDVTALILPGNIRVGFTGHDVRHADGRQLQRKGIQPHIEIRPSIQGIREGRDEILEKAVEYLKKTVGRSPSKNTN